MTPSGGSRQHLVVAPGGWVLRKAGLLVALAVALVGGGMGVGTAAADPVAPYSAHASIAPTSTGSPPASSSAGVHSQAATPGGAPGYWETTTTGQVTGYGVATYGDLRNVPLNRPIVGMAAAPSGQGYWLVASDGGVFTFGSARYFGSTGAIALNKPIVGIAPTPDGGGYWLVASDGGIFAFGDAGFYGSTGAMALNKPIVGMAATPDGRGYWLVASDGGIFAFGDTTFYGSTGAMALNKPIVGMAATPDGRGYWLVASDGGIFAFGDTTFYGSTGNITLNQPIVGMATTVDGHGYWLVAADGGIFTYGDATFQGSSGGSTPSRVVSIAATDAGNPYQASTLGYDVSFPQCATGSSPPPGTPFTIVGVNDGLSPQGAATQTNKPYFNPCFAKQAASAGANLSVYLNLDNITGPNSLAAATAIGKADVDADTAFVAGEGYHPQLWWLDIEAPCNFSGTSGPLWECGSGQVFNQAVIEGAIAELHAMGLTAGIYCTYLQWPATVGPGITEPNIPIWIAGASSPEDLVNFCSDPTKLFAGGTPYLVQQGGGDLDQDYACPV